MSIATVEIRAFSGPDLVELQGVNRPAIVRLNVGPKGDDGANGGSTSAWNYKAKTNATSGYPGNGYLLWNNATQTSATSIIVSHLSDDDTDLELLLSFFTVGQKLFIQDRDESANNQVWQISGTPTVTGANTSTAYYTFPVTLLSSAGTPFANNHQLIFGAIAVATNTVTSATTTNFATGQVLYANGSVIGSLSRSGIDTRTTFPNDDVTAATAAPTPDTIVKRDGGGSITVFSIITTTGGNLVLTDSNQNPLSLTSSEMTDEQAISFPNESGLVNVQAVKSANCTAANGGVYVTVATLTVTDPTPSEGANFSVLVRNGTATVGGIAYSTAGSLIRRVYHSGAWQNYEYKNHAQYGTLATVNGGTGVATALAVNVGSAGAFVVNGGALGTPSSGTLTSCTGLPISTGVSGLGANVATFLATPTSANLAAAVTDETGTGSLVFANSPTITTPTIAQINVASSLLILGAGASGLFGLRSNSATGYSSLELLNSGGTQMGGFGYANASAGAYADQVYFYSAGKALILASAAGSRHVFLSTTGDVSIGSGAAANTRAVLDLTSTTKGFLPPRMTTTQRDAITSVPAGLMIYNTTTNKLNFYNGSAWAAVTSA